MGITLAGLALIFKLASAISASHPKTRVKKPPRDTPERLLYSADHISTPRFSFTTIRVIENAALNPTAFIQADSPEALKPPPCVPVQP
jgi:hypothetical protein